MNQGEHTVSIVADVRELEKLRSFFAATAQALGVEDEPAEDLLLALNEAATNIIVHGYRGRPGVIELHVCPVGVDLELHLRDGAPLFNPTSVPPLRTDLPLAQRRLGGMGVHLARHFTDELRYAVTPQGGNELTLVKRGVLTTPTKEASRGTDD